MTYDQAFEAMKAAAWAHVRCLARRGDFYESHGLADAMIVIEEESAK